MFFFCVSPFEIDHVFFVFNVRPNQIIYPVPYCSVKTVQTELEISPWVYANSLIWTIRCRIKFHFQMERGERQQTNISNGSCLLFLYYVWIFVEFFLSYRQNVSVCSKNLLSLIQSNSCFEDIDNILFSCLRTANCWSILLHAEW